MPKRVAPQRVAAEQDDVRREDERPDPDAERHGPGRRVLEPQGVPDVEAQEHEQREREDEEVAVQVLHDQRERVLAPVARSRLAHAARRRVVPERLVVGAAIVVAGQPEADRRPQDQERRREGHRIRPPARPRPQEAVRRVSEDLGRIERREIRPRVIVLALERRPRGVHDERREREEDAEGLRQPGVEPSSLRPPADRSRKVNLFHPVSLRNERNDIVRPASADRATGGDAARTAAGRCPFGAAERLSLLPRGPKPPAEPGARGRRRGPAHAAANRAGETAASRGSSRPSSTRSATRRAVSGASSTPFR